LILNAISHHRGKPCETDLKKVLEDASRVIRRRSLIFVLSDFISKPDWEGAFGILARRHDVVAVRLTDPLESRLPDLGFLTFQDAETGEQIFVDTHDGGFQGRFAAAADARESALRIAFQNAGVDAIELSTEDDVLDALMGFAEMRKHSLRRSA
jgi:uncharacterized protein (DUF58 family)